MLLGSLKQTLKSQSKTFEEFSEKIFSVDTQKDKNTIITSQENGIISIANYDGKILHTFCFPHAAFVKFIPASDVFLTYSQLEIRLYRQDNYIKVSTKKAHKQGKNLITVHHKYPIIVTAGDNSLHLWKVVDRMIQLCTTIEQYPCVTDIIYHPVNCNIIASYLDTSISIYGFESKKKEISISTKTDVTGIQYGIRRDKVFLIHAEYDKIVIWDDMYKCSQEIKTNEQANYIWADPQLPVIFVCQHDGLFRLLDVKSFNVHLSTHSTDSKKIMNIVAKNKYGDYFVIYNKKIEILTLKNSEPMIAIDTSAKNIIKVDFTQIQLSNVKKCLVANNGLLGNVLYERKNITNIIPMFMKHNSDGTLISLWNNNQYEIYTATQGLLKLSGDGLNFAWGSTRKQFLVSEQKRLLLYNEVSNKAKPKVLKFESDIKMISGGPLVSVYTDINLKVYDWQKNLLYSIETPVFCECHWAVDMSILLILTNTDMKLVKKKNNCLEVVSVYDKTATSCTLIDKYILYTFKNKVLCVLKNNDFIIQECDEQIYFLKYIPGKNKMYLYSESGSIFVVTLYVEVLNFIQNISNVEFEKVLEKFINNTDIDLWEYANLLYKNVNSNPRVFTTLMERVTLSSLFNDLDTSLSLLKDVYNLSDQKWIRVFEIAKEQGKIETVDRYLNERNFVFVEKIPLENISEEIDPLYNEQAQDSQSLEIKLFKSNKTDIPPNLDLSCERSKIMFINWLSHSLNTDRISFQIVEDSEQLQIDNVIYPIKFNDHDYVVCGLCKEAWAQGFKGSQYLVVTHCSKTHGCENLVFYRNKCNSIVEMNEYKICQKAFYILTMPAINETQPPTPKKPALKEQSIQDSFPPLFSYICLDCEKKKGSKTINIQNI